MELVGIFGLGKTYILIIITLIYNSVTKAMEVVMNILEGFTENDDLVNLFVPNAIFTMGS